MRFSLKRFIFVLAWFITMNPIANSQEQSTSNRTIPEHNVKRHSISVNPFMLPVYSANLRYNYRFGAKKHWAICGRATYLSPIIEFSGEESIILLGAGVKYIPYYNSRLAIGVDFSPTFMNSFSSQFSTAVLFPANFNLDLYFGKVVGLAIDFGVAYTAGNIFDSKLIPRGFIGLMFRFGEIKTQEESNRSRY